MALSVKGKSIGIIGGGIAGLTSAIALARLGAGVTIFEQAPEIKEVGAGIQISANGLIVLHELGVDPELANPASRPKALELRDYENGKLISKIDQNADANFPYMQCHRADLIAALLERAQSLGVVLKLGATAKIDDPFGAQAQIRCGERTLGFDGVIAADGMNSPSRIAWFDGTPAKFTGQIAWRATINAPSDSSKTRIFMGPGKHLVIYPLRGGQMLNIVAIREQAQLTAQDWELGDKPENLQQAYSDFCPDAQKIIKQIKDVKLWGLYGHKPLQSWTRGRVALIGDAAHPMLPSMAQGACMAMEDAYVLADALDAAPDIESGLIQYEQVRKLRASKVQRLSARNAKVFHISNPALRKIVHFVLANLSKYAPKRMAARFDWIYKHDVTKQ